MGEKILKQIKMIRTEKGSENGINIKLFKKDNVYNVGLELYKVFVDEIKCAAPYTEVVEAPVVKLKEKTKAVKDKEKDTKAFSGPEENKGEK